MKNIGFALLLLAYLSNCQKNNLPIPGTPVDPVDTSIVVVDTALLPLGQGAVLKNGVAWNAPFEAWYYHSDSVFQIRAEIVHSNLLGEHFFIIDIPCKKKKYSLEYHTIANNRNLVPESFFAMSQDYDQGIGDFYVDTTRLDNYLEVLHYDSTEQTAEGRFQVFMKKRYSDNPWPGVPDSIYLTEGKFHLKIKKP